MSSRLHRGGGVEIEPVAWNRVASRESMLPAADVLYVPSPGAGLNGRDGPSQPIPDQRLQSAFEEGQAAARRETAASLDAMQLRLARTIEELSGLRQRFRHEAEEDVVALALAIARRILHRELTVAPEALLGLVKAALEKVEQREVHRVRIRPEDRAMVQQHLEKMGLPQRVEVVADPGLDRGAAILESSRGALDASVETQLAEIERGFADLVRRA